MTASVRARLAAIDALLAQYEAALAEGLLSGAESANLSAAGTAQGYKRWSPEAFRAEISRLRHERASLIRGGKRRRTCPDFE